MQKLILACVVILSACSSSPDTERKTVPLKLGALPHAPEAEDVLFAKLHKQDAVWQVVSIAAQRMPVDLLKGEERIYIETNTQRVMPDYDHHQYSNENRQLFDCGQDVKFNKQITYNPCTSAFSNNVNFAEGWFGWTKRLDVVELNAAIKQTELLTRASQEMALLRQERQRCRDLRLQAQQVIENQKVALRVIDQTNLYQKIGHELVAYDLNIQPEIAAEGCEKDLAEVKLNYDLGLHHDFNLVLELRGKTDGGELVNDKLSLKRRIAEADKQLVPTLYITGKKVNRYNLYQTWSNAEVAIDWQKLDINETDLRQYFDIRNLSTSPIEVQRVTFYINNHAVTHREAHKLLPLSSKSGLEHASRYFMLDKGLRKNIDDIKVIDNKSEQAEFGIKLSYRIKGEERSLFKKEMVLLSSIL